MNRLLLILILSLTASAELVLEITQSAKQPIKIAVLQKDANTAIGEDIINVIRSDLQRTGEFTVLGSSELLSVPNNESEVIQRDWLLLDVDSIIFVEVVQEDLSLNYRLFHF